MIQQSGSVSEALKELEKKYKSVLLSAVQSATDKAVEDIYKFSVSLVDQYYANYQPSIYERTGGIYNTLVPIAEVANGGDTVVSTVGIGFNSGPLNGYKASSKYGTADGEWILSNYLMGIHPATNGGTSPDTAVYIPWQDGFSPDALTKKYLQLYKNKFQSNVNSHLGSFIMR
jgi:hypothetical protein